MFVPDLEPRSPIVSSPWVRAIGWLSKDNPMSTGAMSAAFMERLQHLCASSFESAEAMGWPIAAGVHVCELCERYHAGGNLGVPGPGVLFVAPEMIHHYVAEHGYRPPDAFVGAVLSCPTPGTKAYAAAVRDYVSGARSAVRR